MRYSLSISIALISVVTLLVACEPQAFDRALPPRKPPVKAPASQAPQLDKNICNEPRKAATGRAAYIVNGTREPTLVPMSPTQKTAVVAIVDHWGSPFCTGTLIAPRFVFTAKHCTRGSSPRDMRVQLSANGRDALATLDVVAITEHGSADLAILELADDATARVAVTPIPVNALALDASWVGQRVEASGFGAINPSTGQQDGRMFVAEPVYQIRATRLTISGEGYHGVCFGDSGGPVLATLGNDGLRVLGALSNGDSSCTGHDNYTRADVFVAWVESIAGPMEGGASAGCGALTSTGRCEAQGGRALYCDAGQLREDRCDAAGEACGYDAEAQGYRCLPVAQDPCQGLDALGSCDGDRVVWCAAGELRQFNCGACGWSCGWASDATGFDCVQRVDTTPVPADPCAGLDFLGRCNGDVAEWCQDGQLRSFDCGSSNATCGFVDDSMGYYCRQPEPEPQDPCGGLDYLGECDGTSARWCQDGQLRSVDCADYGRPCGYIDGQLGYYCQAPAAP